MSVDAQRFNDLMTYLNMVWSAPFQICISLYFLWQTLGPAVLAGVGVMLIMMVVSALLANLQKKLQVSVFLDQICDANLLAVLIYSRLMCAKVFIYFVIQGCMGRGCRDS